VLAKDGSGAGESYFCILSKVREQRGAGVGARLDVLGTGVLVAQRHGDAVVHSKAAQSGRTLELCRDRQHTYVSSRKSLPSLQQGDGGGWL
jgi:hypothetical protein